jgi:hypothetical protein
MKASKTEELRYYDCELCEDKESQERDKLYTHEELIAHISTEHPQWRLCKGCWELITKLEYDEGKGWCGLCVYLCLDCMDTEKYPEGP